MSLQLFPKCTLKYLFNCKLKSFFLLLLESLTGPYNICTGKICFSLHHSIKDKDKVKFDKRSKSVFTPGPVPQLKAPHADRIEQFFLIALKAFPYHHS